MEHSGTMILTLDAAGSPAQWSTLEKATYYYAKGLVAWDLGDAGTLLRGGVNAASGKRSTLDIKPIISIAGKANAVRDFRPPTLERRLLLRRDRCICAYCGETFRESELTLDHVQPESRKGPTSWMNLVAACKACNVRKDDRTPEEAHMPLLYVPYVPNRYEAFILSNRRILADQMEFLRQGLPEHSRILQDLA